MEKGKASRREGKLVEAGTFKGSRMLNSKEAVMGAVLFTLRRAKSLEISRVYVLLDALEVIEAINGSRTTLPKGVARANPALVERLNNEDRPFAISENSRICKERDFVPRRSLYHGAPIRDHSDFSGTPVGGTTVPKVVARANPALVEWFNNEDRPFAISENSRITLSRGAFT
ncbi:hypothetical protein CKAN_02598500 [Cinnamomum micranthum f. kanehirae]|uniref:Uncharacterized protein n=1 Tax=Cinnamomum micranthum f. kanehirae TaxID=337451 RepID=A0A3S3NXW9_9MAGN|nr:hypothetical protein CKAN_02598500 [Cinnamomum micranthum f. kanehirae]